jgi:predicted aldo/keto reductase-like oxidoreductase
MADWQVPASAVCLQCEGKCPQHIEITARLREIAEAFE